MTESTDPRNRFWWDLQSNCRTRNQRDRRLHSGSGRVGHVRSKYKGLIDNYMNSVTLNEVAVSAS
jgi:hypothetical protein